MSIFYGIFHSYGFCVLKKTKNTKNKMKKITLKIKRRNKSSQWCDLPKLRCKHRVGEDVDVMSLLQLWR
jgi:hypothetical protein